MPGAVRPIFDVWPAIAPAHAFAPLGDFPTPVDSLEAVVRAAGAPRDDVFAKRDDLTSPIYGGNKVRTLEALLGLAQRRGATHVIASGAFGSNHAAATVFHARRAGLEPGVLLFPQPQSATAAENLRAVLGSHLVSYALPHWSALPFGIWRVARREKALGRRPFIMVPGGATPEGALGYISAALEVAFQVQARLVPLVREVVVGVGSTCTSAGLLAGFALAARLGIGFTDRGGRPAPPRVVAVRVTPWPVTSAHRIVSLAVRASRLLARAAGDTTLELAHGPLASMLRVEGRYLGRGYGHATAAGHDAIRLWRDHAGTALDTTYSAKAAAAFLDIARAGTAGPLLYWSTKSTGPLPTPDLAALEAAPPRMRRFLVSSPLATYKTSRPEP